MAMKIHLFRMNSGIFITQSSPKLFPKSLAVPTKQLLQRPLPAIAIITTILYDFYFTKKNAFSIDLEKTMNQPTHPKISCTLYTKDLDTSFESSNGNISLDSERERARRESDQSLQYLLKKTICYHQVALNPSYSFFDYSIVNSTLLL